MNGSADVAKQQLDGDHAGCPVCEAAVRAGDFVVQEPSDQRGRRPSRAAACGVRSVPCTRAESPARRRTSFVGPLIVRRVGATPDSGNGLIREAPCVSNVCSIPSPPCGSRSRPGWGSRSTRPHASLFAASSGSPTRSLRRAEELGMLVTSTWTVTDELGAKSRPCLRWPAWRRNLTFGVAREPQLRRISHDER